MFELRETTSGKFILEWSLFEWPFRAFKISDSVDGALADMKELFEKRVVEGFEIKTNDGGQYGQARTEDKKRVFEVVARRKRDCHGGL
jgi:hypothetical protein